MVFILKELIVMTVDGREDLFHYTYLNANRYLSKFRNALNLPNLSLSLLAALLKTYKDRTRMAGFIVANREGKKCLYNKEILNKILGMSNDGHFYLKPEQNPNLQMLHKFIDEWDMKAVEKENPAQYDISSYQNDDEDMEKVSNKLIHDDNYLEEFDTKKALKRLMKRRDPDGIEKKKKNIIITESQFNALKKKLAESYFVEPEKVKIVQKFLDDNFVKGALPSIGEDGYPKPIWIVGLKIPFSQEVKNMTATQAFYMLQDKFKHIYSDSKQRDKFLKRVLIDWYNGNISKHGLLSRNNY